MKPSVRSAVEQHALPGKHDPPPSLTEIVEHAAHLLPEQAPLHAFVHHNTLHAFEHLPFETAVVQAAQILDTEPFQKEHEVAKHFETGRILPQDVEVVVADTLEEPKHLIFAGGPTRAAFRAWRLQTFFEVPRGQALQFVLAEHDVRGRFHGSVSAKRKQEILDRTPEKGRSAGPLGRENSAGDVAPVRREGTILRRLWEALLAVAPSSHDIGKRGKRRRDDLLATTLVDADEIVHAPLIRLCAAFLDQGIAYWPMPERERGFLAAVRSLYSLPVAPPNTALKGLAKELKRQTRLKWSAEDTIGWALSQLDVDAADRSDYITETLLALRGWAGMMRHLELRPDRAPVAAPPATLMDFLAVRLVFDTVAARNLLRTHLGNGATFGELRTARKHQLSRSNSRPGPDLELVFEAFVVAQQMPLDLDLLANPEHARAWLKEVRQFDELERRRYLHLAYERRHRVEVLDGISAHCRVSAKHPPLAQFQAVFCIDDREESLRRHLEECFPAVETYGYAGFFGAAMNYQGIDDVRPRPLCPVTVRPEHLIVEQAESDADQARYRQKQRYLASITRSLSVSSKTLWRGGLLSMVLGMAALVPLVLRSLFPRLAEAWAHALEHRLAPKPQSRLLLERPDSATDTPYHGYTTQEMTAIVGSALRTMNLVNNLCPLVLIVGHGSSSLNNPHEAAHDCGATGGGRGGPNARAFAAMANHPEVRVRLANEGIRIADTTWFVGAYHNTCDDAMSYYDEQRLPASHHAQLEQIKHAMAQACELDADERCRRFETLPARLPEGRAIGYARIHAADLAEPRPEYGHATNAVCIVGRRDRTRGLFLDRRAFLVSYDPTSDPEGELLASLLVSVGPVGAGINLEYYFSFVDPLGYGSGTKLPHNITGLIGVMDGHASDLRTGLPWQMVEIHEPVRLLTIVEAKRAQLTQILQREAGLAQLVTNGWIQLVAWDPDSAQLSVFDRGAFHDYQIESQTIPIVPHSVEHYGGRREHLPPAHVEAAFGGLRP